MRAVTVFRYSIPLSEILDPESTLRYGIKWGSGK